MHKILVLMTTYNGSDFLQQQLDSIIEQEQVHLSIEIQDDCSDHSTKNILKEYQKRPNINITHNKLNSGGAAKNFYKLFREVSIDGFDYIALCDQDDIWQKDKLIKSIDKLKDTKSNGLSTSVRCFDGKNDWVSKQSQTVREFDYIFEGGGQGCTFLLEKNLSKNLASFLRNNEVLYNDFFFHDWLIYLFFRVNKFKWCFYDYASVNYRQHSENEIGAQGGKKSILKRFKLIQNGWYAKQVRFALEISKQYHKGKNFIHLYNIFLEKKNLVRSLKLSWLILLKGRRKIRDRFVLVLSCLFGYL